MAPYAMHWAAMLACRELGCTSYEMGAVSPGATPDHPFYGMYRFKTGFGGRIEYSCGSWDYPFDHDSYMMFSNAEKLKGGEMPSHL
jgi:lipid II:glycine glycyltransferase (peptidoglycan interpeptide bridge formation enzyme)